MRDQNDIREFINQQTGEYTPTGIPEEDNQRLGNLVDIDLDEKEIKEKYEQNGFFQLRKIDPHKTHLVIGCGNGPFDSVAGYRLNLTHTEDLEYRQQHMHADAITVNPELACNPTLVCAFGHKSICHLFEGKKFKKITIEGVALLEEGTIEGYPSALSDLKQLLDTEGEVVIDYGDKEPRAIFHQYDLQNWKGMKDATLPVKSSEENIHKPSNQSTFSLGSAIKSCFSCCKKKKKV